MTSMAWIIGCAVAAISVTASAQTGPIVVEGGLPTVAVSYADLNIASPSGLRTLNNRVNRAASMLCTEHGRKDLGRAMLEHRCLDFALSRAKLDIDRAIADEAARLAGNSTIKVAVR